MVNPTLAAAQEYCRRGWSVVPIPHRKKGPILKGWQDLQLTEADCEEHFNGQAQNIGVLLGSRSGGLVDLDLDTPEARCLADIFLPKTSAEFGRESSPRSHRLYVASPLPSYCNYKDSTDTLLEVRSADDGKGRQTIFPPSVHPSGEQIHWNSHGEPARVDGVQLEIAANKLAAATLLARRWHQGSRHEYVLAIAGALARSGWNQSDTTDFVVAIADVSGDEELPDRRAAVADTYAKVGNGTKATGWPTLGNLIGQEAVDRLQDYLCIKEQAITSTPKGEWSSPIPLSNYDVPPFPQPPEDSAFWEFWEFCAAVSESVQVAVDLPAMLALTVASAAIAKKAKVHVRADHFEPLNLFTCVVLDPANRKSAVFGEMTRPLLDFEAAERDRLLSTVEANRAELTVLELRLKSAQSSAAKSNDEGGRAIALIECKNLAKEFALFKETRLLALPTLVSDDCTPEALARLLNDNGGRLAALSAEGGIFGTMAGRYSQNNVPNIDVYLKSHVGDTVKVHRIGRPDEYVRAPALTIGLTVQYDVLRSLSLQPSFRGRGLLGRFFYSLPHSWLGQRKIDPAPVSEVCRNGFGSLINDLLRLERPLDERGSVGIYVFTFDQPAQKMFDDFATEIERELGDGERFEYMRDWAGKLVGGVARIAGVLHSLQFARSVVHVGREIDARTMEYSIRIGRYLADHAQAAFTEMGADPSLALARKILERLQSKHVRVFTKRDLFQWVKGGVEKVTALDEPLAILESHDFIRLVPRPEKAVGRPRSDKYELNPLSQKPQKPQNHDAAGSFEDIENIERGAPAEKPTGANGQRSVP